MAVEEWLPDSSFFWTRSSLESASCVGGFSYPKTDAILASVSSTHKFLTLSDSYLAVHVMNLVMIIYLNHQGPQALRGSFLRDRTLFPQASLVSYPHRRHRMR